MVFEPGIRRLDLDLNLDLDLDLDCQWILTVTEDSEVVLQPGLSVDTDSH